MRNLAASGVSATLAAMALAACSTEAPAERASTPTYHLEPREVRPDEQALRIKGADGDTGYELIGLSRQKSLLGSHAEMYPDGEFFRIRLVVTNNGRSSAVFDTARQRLVLSSGKTLPPDSEAMLVKRQPGEFNLGSGVRVEFDLYYDVPDGAEPKALRAFGGPTLTDLADAEGTDISLR